MALIGFLFSLLIYISPGLAQENTMSKSVNELIQQGESYRRKGQYRQANSHFIQALKMAKQLATRKAEALVTGLLGNNYLQQRRYQQAKPLLDQAWIMAQDNHWPDLAALHANYLGNYYSSQRQAEIAKKYYQQCLDWALKTEDYGLVIQAKVNLARLAEQDNDNQRAWSLLSESHLTLNKIVSNNDKLHFLLQMGHQLLQLKASESDLKNQIIKLTYQVLTVAFNLAEQQSDQRGQSLANGYLAQLYESQNRSEDALIHIRQAVDIAQRIDAKDLLLKWEWQRGRILKIQTNQDGAIAAYRRAVAHIEAIRQDIPVDYHKGHSSFRETLEPVYLGLADLLLQQVDQLSAPRASKVLKEVRQTIELIKKTELEDYFHNRCDIQTLPEVNLESIAPKTATIYPIILPDRLELLVGVGGDIYHRSVPVVATEIKKVTRILANRLRRRRPQFTESAQQLYQWLIAPIEDLLKNHKVDSLVVVPDSELRLVPFAALFDGQTYLIERYAVVNSPGLTLFDPKPIPKKGIKALLAGLSQPGSGVKSLPLPNLQVLLSSVAAQTSDEIVNNKTRDISNLLISRGQDNSRFAALTAEKIKDLLNNPAILKKAQQALALPGVEKEIFLISELFPSTSLINENFVTKRLSKEISNSPYQIVHLASHGFFGHSSEQSFVMAYDKILSMDQLEILLQSKKIADSPIDLLTLSACQTAEGDDRSPLGLSGVALKAKVRSVLGSLWPVSDDATVQLMKTFYKNLNAEGLSKAQALQQAQISLLRNPKRSHPFFWSPFILIGNWL